MATPKQLKSSSPSTSLGRPLPVLTADMLRATKTTDRDVHAEEDSDGGRLHTSSSLPRTKFTSHTPSSEREAISKLKTRMTFSDHSADSSARSTPMKNTNLSVVRNRGAATDPTSKRSTSRVVSSAPVASNYVRVVEKDECASEGEITGTVSVNDILSKLDSVKNYLKEAESLHRQMQAKIAEPGALSQIEKLTKLIQELRQQEASYLAILLRIIDHNESGSQLDTTQDDSDNESEEEGSEFSEDESADEEDDPADETIISSQDRRTEGDRSLSLRAQLNEEHDPDQEEELRVLKHQQQMLRDLIEQQKKIKELEEKQAELLRRREEAQNQLLEAEAKTIEYRRLQEEAAAEEQEQSETTGNDNITGDDLEPQEDEIQLEGDDSVEALEHQQLLLQRISALKARKDKVESMLDSLTAMHVSESGENSENGENERTLSGHSLDTSVDQEKELNGVREFVNTAELSSDPKVAEVEAKLRQAAEAKKKLAELRQMIDFLKESTGEFPNEEPTQSSSEPLQWRLSLDPSRGGHGERGVASDNEEEEEEELDTTLNDGGVSLNRSVVADYQMRLAEKQREVADLQKQKEELKLMQEKLLAMKTTYELEGIEDADPGGVQTSASAFIQEESSELLGPAQDADGDIDDEFELPLHLAEELRKQKELYDEIMSKTKRLQELQIEYEEGVKGSDQDTYSLTSSTRQLTEADLTAATWGGSTAQTDDDDESDDSSSSGSLPVATVIDREGSQLAMAGSASVKQSDTLVGPEEQLNFTVTRHTPRHYPPRRTPSISDESPQNVGKKMKLGSEENFKSIRSPGAVSGGRSKAAGTGAQPSPGPSSHFSAVWPGVIFPSLVQGGRDSVRKDGATQTAMHPPTSSSSVLPNPTANEAEASTPGASVPFSSAPVESNTQQSHLVQQQLSLMSNMCTELLHGQNSLIHALCNRLDTTEAQTSVQEHMNQLHGYHRELQLYYEEISQAHAQITSSQAGSQVPHSETEDPINAHPYVDRETEHHTPPVLTSLPELSTAAGQQDHMRPSFSAPSCQPGTNEGVNPFHYAQSNPQYNSPGMYGYPLFPQQSGLYGSAGPTPHAPNGEQSETGSEVAQQPGFSVPRSPRPPPPPPPFVPHPSYAGIQSPYHPPRPLYQPGWYSYPSPMRYQNPYGVSYSPRYPPHLGMSNTASGSRPQAPMLGSPYGYYPWPYYGPNAYPPRVNSSTSLQEDQAAAFLNPYTLTPGDSREGLPPHGPQFPMHGHPMGLHPGVGDFVLNSPSGITAASVQVQPPSTAPPSVNMQQSYSSLNNNNNNTGATGYIPTSNTSTLQVPLQSRSCLGMFGHVDVPASISNDSVALSSSALGLSASLPTLLPPATSSSYDVRLTMASQFLREEGDVANERKEAVTTGFEKEMDDLEDEESISSMPLSVPGDIQVTQSSSSLLEQAQSTDPAAGFSVFDALRDTIYSEVATLIASNESRPHFLVELFRELQLLSSDYLRQRALYNIQDLVTRFLTEEGGEDKETTPTPGIYQGWVDSASERTPSESEVTTEDDAPKPPLSHSTSEAFDYVELVHSASSLSTPPHTSSDQPFASEDLGETVICLDKAMAKVRQMEKDVGASPGLKPPAVSPGPLVTEEEADGDDSLEYVALEKTELDTHLLDEQIKEIMTEVIPILKANMSSDCTVKLLNEIKTTILDLVLEQENKRNPDFLEVLTKQLHATVATAMEKYADKKFSDCGEDMLVDLSEVLFNELSFFRLMQDLRDHPQLSSDFKSVTSSQTTTENEDNGEGDENQAVRIKPLPMDPLLLQALSLEANKTLVEEEEALGKVRDDELASMWDPDVQRLDRSSMSGDEDSTLHIAETPLTEAVPEKSADGESGSVSEPVVNEDPTQGHPHESSEEVTPTIIEASTKPVVDAQPTVENNLSSVPTPEGSNEDTPLVTELIASENQTAPDSESADTENRESPSGLSDSVTPNEPPSKDDSDASSDSTPPTSPVAAHSCGVLAGQGVGNQESDIVSVEGIHTEENGGSIQHHASSPPGSLGGTPQSKLDIQMKSEQDSIEGIPGIIVSIEEHGQELAGNEDELPMS